MPLIHQNELGPGHMVKSAAGSLQRLEMELPGAPAAPFLFEDIGNGLCRLNLGALREIAPGTVTRFFLFTANTHQGSTARLEEKLAVLAEACRSTSPIASSTLSRRPPPEITAQD